MTDNQQPAAFLSYVHSDDDHESGRISRLRARLEGEVRMHTGKQFRIFQDRNDLEWGQNWEERITNSLTNVIFLIPIITPSYFNSPACRSELELFLKREHSLGSNQLILPVYYVDCDQISNATDTDQLGSILRTRQYSDWRDLRFRELESPDVSKQLASLAIDIKSRTKSLADVFSIEEAQPKSADDTPKKSRSKAIASKSAPVEKIKSPPEVLSHRAPWYIAYTTEFDEIVRAESFLMNNPSDTLHNIISKKINDITKKNQRSIQIFESELRKWLDGDKASIIFLLDNSGSLRGDPIVNLSSWIAVLADVFERSGIAVKVIGFTTRAWKGGQSREKWLSHKRPSHPGRLNDVRYIIYKDFSETVFSASQNFSVMLQEGILKENVDGEAILFAYDDLLNRVSDKRLMAVFSDGAPVDDSTLSVNEAGFLEKHLRHAIKFVESTDVGLCAVGVNHDVERYYGDVGITANSDNIGAAFFKAFRKTNNFRKNLKK